MSKKTILTLGLIGALILSFILILNIFRPSGLKSPSLSNQLELTAPNLSASKTLKIYEDPSGFSFSYPDNLSILNNELKDPSSYAELQLTAKGADNSLVLKIADSKLKSLDEWVKANKAETDTTKEAKLGNLKAVEITSKEKVMLGALDQGILFNIEVPLGTNKDFWMDVYDKVLADFSFAPPAQADQGSSSDDVTFDGEEVVQ